MVACAKDSRFLKQVVGFDGTANHDAELDRVALNKDVRFEAVRDRPRRRRAARLHLGHDRRAEGDDAFPPRPADHRRRLREGSARRHARRRVRRLAAARLHLRARRARDLPAALRRGGDAARERDAAEHGRDHRDLQGDDQLHRADRLSRHARRDGQGRRPLVAAHRRLGRRDAAGAGLRGLDDRRPASRSSTASARPRCCTSSSPTGSPTWRRPHRQAGDRLRGEDRRRGDEGSAARHDRAARRARPDRLPLHGRRPPEELCPRRLEPDRRFLRRRTRTASSTSPRAPTT